MTTKSQVRFSNTTPVVLCADDGSFAVLLAAINNHQRRRGLCMLLVMQAKKRTCATTTHGSANNGSIIIMVEKQGGTVKMDLGPLYCTVLRCGWRASFPAQTKIKFKNSSRVLMRADRKILYGMMTDVIDRESSESF